MTHEINWPVNNFVLRLQEYTAAAQELALKDTGGHFYYVDRVQIGLSDSDEEITVVLYNEAFDGETYQYYTWRQLDDYQRTKSDPSGKSAEASK